jgi:putative endonuclease
LAEGPLKKGLFLHITVMFTVYVLYSPTFNQIYIGYTSDMAKRFLSHNELATKGHTIKYRPWVIAYIEVCLTKAEAMKREKQLKSANGRKFIWDTINIKFGSSDN